MLLTLLHQKRHQLSSLLLTCVCVCVGEGEELGERTIVIVFEGEGREVRYMSTCAQTDRSPCMYAKESTYPVLSLPDVALLLLPRPAAPALTSPPAAG